MSGVASFVSALAERMSSPSLEADPIPMADLYLAMRSIGYKGPITMHCQENGLPAIVEVTIVRKWKVV